MNLKTSDLEEPLFHGALADEYDFLLKICPQHLVCAQQVAMAIAQLPPREGGAAYQALELGCGSGLSTRLFLHARPDLHLQAIDFAKPMLDQAARHLESDLHQGRLILQEGEMYEILAGLPSASLDLVISNYAIHNLLERERERLMPEIARVLRPGGFFINGDRYGDDDPTRHLALLQEEVRGYFRIFQEMNRSDLLEAWILHVLSDESLERVMRMTSSLSLMRLQGFDPIDLLYREGVNAVISARIPA